jgi:DnaJ family protein C protein 7
MQHTQNPMAYWIRGQAVFSIGDTALGLKILLEALRLDPDSQLFKDSFKRSKKVSAWMQEAKQKVFQRSFSEAVPLYAQCIETCQPLAPKAPLYATLHTQRAEAYLRLKDFPNALKDCAKVLYVQDDHIPACLVRLQAYHGLEQHETALQEVQELLQKFPGDMKLRQAHEKADFLCRKAKRVDYYKLMAVSSIASEVEIKKAYKRKALEWHPDRHPPAPDKQAHAQKQFQLLGEGLEILCDDFTRRLYDEGYDLEQIRERVEAAKQAAHNPRYNHHGYQNW